MATCNVTTLMADAGCFACLGTKEIQTVMLALLCRILQAYDPMATCDVQTLVNDSKCFACLSPQQMQLAQLQLLCEILNSPGLAAAGCVTCGDSDPVDAPTVGCCIYYRTDNGAFWFWNGAAWILFLAPP